MNIPVKIFDWQTAQREGTTDNSTRPTAEDSWHPGFGDPQSLLYMAPEAIAGMAFDAQKLDIFSLGTIAYHMFSGHAPATSIEELHQKCRTGHGLRISEVMDGVRPGVAGSHPVQYLSRGRRPADHRAGVSRTTGERRKRTDHASAGGRRHSSRGACQ